MGIFRNSSGLITRGLGEAQKLLTRGLGPAKKIIKGLPPKVDRTKEYIFEILGPVKKEDTIEKNIFSPVKVIINKAVMLKCGVVKKINESFNILVKVSSKRLFQILDAI
ncbi:MAG: hypothetical protein ACTSWD_04940 [Candidatus Heimdallarchaeota archaeon]